MPDVHLHICHGGTALFAVVNVDAQGQRNSTLGIAAIKVGADVAAIESRGAIVDEIGALLAFRRYRTGSA